MKGKLSWLIFNGIFTCCIYFGFFQDVGGFKNLIVFWSWVCLILSILIYTTREGIVTNCSEVEVSKLTKYSVPPRLDIAYDLIVTCVLVYFSYQVTALVYLLHTVFLHLAKDSIRELVEEKEDAREG